MAFVQPAQLTIETVNRRWRSKDVVKSEKEFNSARPNASRSAVYDR